MLLRCSTIILDCQYQVLSKSVQFFRKQITQKASLCTIILSDRQQQFLLSPAVLHTAYYRSIASNDCSVAFHFYILFLSHVQCSVVGFGISGAEP
jgi:hypothetical protein